MGVIYLTMRSRSANRGLLFGYSIPFERNKVQSSFPIVYSRPLTTTSDESALPTSAKLDRSGNGSCYLHVGPSPGDYWTGREIFAAKHLQPGYVKSIALPWSEECKYTQALLERLAEESVSVQQQIYDSGKIDDAILLDVSKEE